LADRAQRSAKAFEFGLLAGSARLFTPGILTGPGGLGFLLRRAGLGLGTSRRFRRWRSITPVQRESKWNLQRF